MSDQTTHKVIACRVAQSLEANVGVLRAGARLDVTDAPDPRDGHVRQSLERAAEIVRACADLGRRNNPTALGMLARAHLEALIRILWVTTSVQNAEELSDVRTEELVRMAKVNLRSGKLRVIDQATGEDETARLLADERMNTKKHRKSVEAYAKEAGVQDLYNVFYRFMSLEVHAHRLDGGHKADWELTAMHLQGIGGLTQAIGHVGVRWLLHRQRPSNEELRGLLGIGR